VDGLKTLSAAFRGVSDIPYLQTVIRQLEAMGPGNFSQVAERLQFTLLPFSHVLEEIPSDVVVSNSSPPSEFLKSPREILLLVGPATGIGDEITLFPLPMWLKAVNQEAKVSVCSAYAGLWERVAGLDRTVQYGSHMTILQALRGLAPFDGYDLVILADFERPGLSPSICYEARPIRYVELSHGTQSVSVVDNQRRWIHQSPGSGPYCVNFYYGLDYLMRWLGLSPRTTKRSSTIVRQKGQRPADRLQIYVNPFTSKYEPSEPYWSHLLSSLVPSPPARPIEFVLEPDPNATTMRFASAVARSAQARSPAGVRFRLTEIGQDSTHSLQDAFCHMERAHIVICSDSFAAHAAPLFDCTTLVLARAGLENWRVPHRSSYYFNADAPIDQIVAAMQQILKRLDVVPGRLDKTLPLSGAERDLENATQMLQSALEIGDLESALKAYREFIPTYREVVGQLPEWPAEFRSLLDDIDYEIPLCTLSTNESIPVSLRPDLLLHLQDRWQQWQISNLRKYLGLMMSQTRGEASR
jgi:hypothetical protein